MSRNPRPQLRSFADPDRPAPQRSCVCSGGPVVVATFRDQQVVALNLEHCGYCPIPHQALDVDSYIRDGEKVPV